MHRVLEVFSLLEIDMNLAMWSTKIHLSGHLLTTTKSAGPSGGRLTEVPL